MKKILLFTFTIAAVFKLAAAESVSFYYTVNQKVFEVSEFEDGLPKLDTEVAAEGVSGSNLDAGFNWSMKGTLPIDAKHALPLLNYSVSRIAPSYGQRHRESWQEAHVRVSAVKEVVPWKSADEGFLVFGWVVDGAVVDLFVSSFNAKDRYNNGTKLLVENSGMKGYPLCWRVVDGQVVEKKPSVWDPFVFPTNENMDYAKLSKLKDKQKNTALHFASANGLDIVVEKLIEQSRKLVRSANSIKRIPMSSAIACGRTEAVRLLLEAKSPLLDSWMGGDSIIRRVAGSGKLDILKLLAPNKAKSREMKAHYSFGIASALNNNHEECVLYLLSVGAAFEIAEESRGKLVLEKMTNGYPQMAFQVMKYLKVDGSYSDDGYSLFHASASYADVELLNRIGLAGADLKQRTSKNLLPMDFAVGLGNVEAICWFIDNGGKPEDGPDSLNPVQYAIKEGKQESVVCLINYGYDVNKELGTGVTPLMYSVYEDELGIARSLLSGGGVWLLDSLQMDRVLAKLVQADAVELLNSVIEQGWPAERRLMNDFTLYDFARFYEAKSVLARLDSLGWTGTGVEMASMKNVEEKPKLVVPLSLDYPVEMQRKYGQRNLLVELALNRDGTPSLLKFADTIEPDLAKLIERSVYKMVFSPAVSEGGAVPIKFKFRVPLEVSMEAEKVFDLAGVDEMPKALRQARPLYPYSLQHTRTSGSVLVEFVLTSEGQVIRARAASFSHADFVGPAIASVQNTVYRPAKINGEPVACRVRVSVNFRP